MTAETILISDIDDSVRLRPVDAARVALIAASIETKTDEGKPGLLQPIVARRNPDDDWKYILVVGAHRLAALRLLGWTKLTVGEHVIIRDTDALSARIDEIDENIARHDLNALDRAIFIAERKKLFDQQRGEARGRPLRKDTEFKEKLILAKLAIINSPRFSEDAASRTGLSKRTIERACELAKRLDKTAIADIRGTMLVDNGVELLALSKLEPEQQRAVASAIKSGAAKTVLQGTWAAGIAKQPLNDPQARLLANLLENFEKASKKTRADFMSSYGLVYDKAAK